MKDYIRKNITPLAIGLALGLSFSMTLEAIDDIVIKVALILKEGESVK